MRQQTNTSFFGRIASYVNSNSGDDDIIFSEVESARKETMICQYTQSISRKKFIRWILLQETYFLKFMN